MTKSQENAISETASIVHAYLCSCASKDGQATPSRKIIAENCGVSISTIDRAVKQLIKTGLVTKVLRDEITIYGENFGSTSNLYLLHHENKNTEGGC